MEVVDRMVGQVLRRLWEAEAAGRGRYLVVVAGDHSTPVVFGDHSNEPVPFAIASVRHAVEVSCRGVGTWEFAIPVANYCATRADCVLLRMHRRVCVFLSTEPREGNR